MNTLPPFVLPTALLALTLAFGLALSRAGRPYNGLLFNVHKLLALAAVVLAVAGAAGLPAGAWSRAALVVPAVLVGLCVLALFASGALMSAGKLRYAWMLAVHRLAPVVMIATVGAAAWAWSP